ncbi:MAG: hypothetical protein F6J89_21600 [Symploca sp. SIO1C4]|uniref:Uncharacterized protein n=1 Tax=Symploca sp. SIO1C4 TaxID=2607765 RepID=A0A6B3NHW8_9CYAN|nr:hypothetical protein [Symploca sp. SIO1C4]
MSDTSLGDLIILITKEMSGTIGELKNQDSSQVKLGVSDINFDIPAYLYLQDNRKYSTKNGTDLRLMVSLPSSIETPTLGQLGRININIALEQNSDEV